MTQATFSHVPGFNQADFKQAPDLDDVQFPLPSVRPWRAGQQKLIANYRAIRRIALQGADYEREQMASKGELRSRRWTADRFYHPAVWIGLLYDGVADCGRSMTRPFVAWLVLLAAFSAIYLWNAGVPPRDWQSACDGVALKWEKAASLSLSNGVPLIGASRAEEARAFYACVSPPPSAAPGLRHTYIPLSATVIQVLQSLLSAALIFLFLLAVRNRFKIK